MATKSLTGKHNYAEFSAETIKARVQKMLAFRDQVDVEKEHVKFSYENRKTGALVPSVSLIPVADCRNCRVCSRGCYDVRNVCLWATVQKNRAINSAIYHRAPEKYWDEIRQRVKSLRFFRYHIGADIQNSLYLHQIVTIAQETPTCEFLVFTKMYHLVNEFLADYPVHEFPKNLHVILSGWKGDTNQNPHNLPVSSPVWKDGQQSCMVTNDVIWCPGDCSACAETNGGCWGLKKGQTVLFEAH